MNTKDLRWFREVCRCGSFSKAAANLFVSQQGLNKCIRNLEQQLGVELLNRSPSGISMTPYGKYLYEKSGPILLEWDSLTMELERMSQMERGTLRLCSAYGILRILSPQFILDFKQYVEHTTIEYAEFPDNYVDDEIIAGNFDVAFHVGDHTPEGFVSLPLFRSSISLLVYEDHPLASRSTVSFTDLVDEPMIIESKAFRIHHMFRQKCLDSGFDPNIIFNTSGFSLCHKLCRQKLGISIVVDRISEDMSGSGLIKIPFEEPFFWNVSMIYRKDFEDQRTLRAFQEYTLRHIEKISTADE